MLTDKSSRNCRAKRLNELRTQFNHHIWIRVTFCYSGSWKRNQENKGYRLRKKSWRRLQLYGMQSLLTGCKVYSSSGFNDEPGSLQALATTLLNECSTCHWKIKWKIIQWDLNQLVSKAWHQSFAAQSIRLFLAIFGCGVK
jgi:hypothetical protein